MHEFPDDGLDLLSGYFTISVAVELFVELVDDFSSVGLISSEGVHNKASDFLAVEKAALIDIILVEYGFNDDVDLIALSDFHRHGLITLDLFK